MADMLSLTVLLTLWAVPASQQPDSLVLVDFPRSTTADWFVVNDGVMGGISSSTLEISSDGTGVFAGHLSLENNGGFASVRTYLEGYDLSTFAGLVLRQLGSLIADHREGTFRLEIVRVLARAKLPQHP